MSTSQAVLRVDNLVAEIATPRGLLRVVDGVSFSVDAGRTLGIVGESGSGKSMTCLSLLNLLPAHARIAAGAVWFGGEDLTKKSPRAMRQLRGRRIGMIVQDPMNSLNPLYRIGTQIGEVFKYHHRVFSSRERWRRALAVMERVRIPAAASRIGNYPHQFSGGMRQRIAAAINIACQPELLIADEPTTALDVTIRLQILQLLRDIQSERNTALMLITHDLPLVARFCDEVAVMYAGRIVEQGPVEQVFGAPAHPYTRGLVDAMPRISRRSSRLVTIPGQPPAAGEYDLGCRFAPRCVHATDLCRSRYPELTAFADGTRQVACWYPRQESV